MQTHTLHIPDPEVLWNPDAIHVNSPTFIHTEPYFSRAVGGYFSLSFTVTVPGMITPATVWNILMQTAAMGGSRLESSIPPPALQPWLHIGASHSWEYLTHSLQVSSFYLILSARISLLK